ncbi:DsbA family protein [Poseidonibacter sp.]|uniref:DsbA family protein n=1 Tax=Poseidonibacter sp. TaxID=2321188 RepID=UPI00359DE1EB
MRNISKLLTAGIVLSTTLFANSSDQNIIEFEKKRISQNPSVSVQEITINTKKELPLEGWHGYILDVKAKIQNKEINAKDIIFSNGKYIAMDLINSENGKSLKDLVTPNLTEVYYDKSKLIAGNHNAKDKVVIFSDPLCPFCMEYIPDVINYVNKNKDSIALYYYNFPLLRLHPAAQTLSKIAEVAKEKGLKDVELKVYTTDWKPYFQSDSKDDKLILDGFNKVFKTKITLEEISKKQIEDIILKDIKMGEDVMVQGTPTIFINGVKDTSKTKIQTLGNK